MPRTRCVPVFLAMLAILLPCTAHAQWVPGGVKVATGISGVEHVPRVDAFGGAVFAANEFAAPGTPGASIARVRADGTIPPGWPSSAVIPTPLLSFGTASDGAGGAYVGRISFEGAVPALVVLHVVPSGGLDPAWPAGGVAVLDSLGSALGVEVAADGAGGVYVVTRNATLSEGSETDYVVRMSRLLPSGLRAPGWPEDGVLISRGPDVPFFNAPMVSAAGPMLQIERRPYGPPLFTFGPPITTLAALTPAGDLRPGWATASIPLPLASDGDRVEIAPDAGGGAFYLLTPASGHQTALRHLLADGTLDPVWSSDGVKVVADTSLFTFMTALVPDDEGGCLAFGLVLEGSPPGTEHSFLMHVRQDGSAPVGWPVALDAESNISGLITARRAIVPDGRHGAFLFSLEGLVSPAIAIGDGYRRLRAQHFAGHGEVAAYWPVSGQVLVGQPGFRYAMHAAPDGHGGAMISWSDVRGDTSALASVDLYALGIGPDGSLTTAVNDVRAASIRLSASPTPAFGESRLSFALAARAHVSLAVFDIGGRRVRQLHDGALETGPHSIAWDGRDESGRPLPQGVYLARASINGVTSDTRIVRLR